MSHEERHSRPWGGAGLTNRPLPNVIVLGAAKAGTTALHYYLDLHPEVAMSRPKELRFFANQVVSAGPFWQLTAEEVEIGARHQNWQKGLDWYQSHFSGDFAVRGEASPEYTAPWYPDASENMAMVVPDVKLIFIARDPIERAVSHYLTLVGAGWETRSLEAALGHLQGLYISRGRYHDILVPYLERFGRSQILILDQEDLRISRRDTVRSLYRFVGVDDSYWSERHERERNPTTARPRHPRVEKLLNRAGLRTLAARLPPGVKWRIEQGFLQLGGPASPPSLEPTTRDRVVAYLADDVRRFRALSGKALSHWSL